jgi:hypothetical protein
MRIEISRKIRSQLYAKSGNRCAFPGCSETLFDNNGNNFSNICHIEGYEKGSKRYNPNPSANERNMYDNLILLCPNHHKLVDSSEQIYTVEVLKTMKAEHEQQIQNQTTNNFFNQFSSSSMLQNTAISQFYNFYLDNSEDEMMELELKNKITNALVLLIPVADDCKNLLVGLLHHKQNLSKYIQNGLLSFQSNLDKYFNYIKFYLNNNIIFENKYRKGTLSEFIEGNNGDVYLMGENIPFKINNGEWTLDWQGKLLDIIYNFFEKNYDKMFSFLNGNIALLN